MICGRSVIRSINALQSRALGITCVHSENGKFVVRITAAFSARSAMTYLRRMLEELAWSQQLPVLAHPLVAGDVPRKEHHLPRPLTPEQDQLIRQELPRRNDLLSNALLLLRHTGMRFGECVDLSLDCVRLWASSKPSAGYLWTTWSVNWSSASVSCVHHGLPARAICSCFGDAAAKCWSVESGLLCAMPQPRSASAPTSCLTSFDTHMEPRCYGQASAWLL
jgi:hypothetical protein